MTTISNNVQNATTPWQSIFYINEEENWRLIDNIENTDEDGLGTGHYFEWYGVGIIFFAAMGVLGNVFSICVFAHKGMRSPFGVYICALLIVDVIYLVCETLLYVPVNWLTRTNVTSNTFWPYLKAAQHTYVACYGLRDLAYALVVWYTFALIAEQYCVIYKPNAVLRFSNTNDKVLKICITILNLTIVVHMVHFFKLVIIPLGVRDFARVCLSDIYIYDAYMWYDLYGYFVLFNMSAWLGIFIMCVAIAVAVITSRYNIGEVLPDQRIFRIFKSGRSIRTSLALGVWYLLCCTFANITFMLTWHYGKFAEGKDCHFRPRSRRFERSPPYYELIFVVCNVLNSSFRFPTLLVANSKFRRLIQTCFIKQHMVAQKVGSMISLVRIPSDRDEQEQMNGTVNQAYEPAWEKKIDTESRYTTWI